LNLERSLNPSAEPEAAATPAGGGNPSPAVAGNERTFGLIDLGAFQFDGAASARF